MYVQLGFETILFRAHFTDLVQSAIYIYISKERSYLGLKSDLGLFLGCLPFSGVWNNEH